MRPGTIALAVQETEGGPHLLGSFSDEQEIHIFESALHEGGRHPVEAVEEWRDQRRKDDEEFGDYVEELISQPFVTPDVKDHGLQWLKSKIRIERLQKTEAEATKVIAQYAFRVFSENPKIDDFMLMGNTAKVRIRVFRVQTSGRSLAA